MRFPTLSLVSVLLTCLLAGCMSVPPTSMVKLARFSPMEADPAVLRVAVKAPKQILVRDGDATLNIRLDVSDPKYRFDEVFQLQAQVPDPSSIGLAAVATANERVTVFALQPMDVARMRDVQLKARAYKASGGASGHGSLSIGVSGCLFSDHPDGPIRVSSYLKTEEDEPYFALLRNFDLRQAMRDAGRDGLSACFTPGGDPI